VTDFGRPLALSLAAHALCLALLLLLPTLAPPVQPPPAAGGIEVAFAPSLPEPEKPPAAQLPAKTEPLPPPAEPPPPAPIEPPPPAPEATAVAPEAPPPPPRKPAVPQVSKPAQRRPERERQPPTFASPVPAAPSRPPVPAANPRTAFAPARAPAPAPSTTISPSYSALLSEWLERHKSYPESARENAEEGRAVLRFVVERDGRVADFAVVQSSGHPDLDAGLDNMMRGATLPPFPPGMTQSRIEVSVTIRFSLGR
jgi:periplasmic protein TonB